VRGKLSVAVSPPTSVNVTEMAALPGWLGAGVSVTVRFEPLPPKTMFWTGTKPGFEEVAVTARLSGGDSESPTVKGNGPAVVSWKMVTLVMAETTGAVLEMTRINCGRQAGSG